MGLKLADPDKEILINLCDDLNTPKALARAHYLADQANKGSKESAQKLKNSSSILGILSHSSENWLKYGKDSYTDKLSSQPIISDKKINKLIIKIKIAKDNKDGD